MHSFATASALVLISLLSACNTANSAVDGVKDAASSVGSAATSLVNVNLSNVLNDLALDLKIDRANVPINAQIPINVAANVCGVSINILSIGGSGSSQGCTATTASPELVQAVQQQLAANGNVGGGAQTNGGTSTGAGTGTSTTGTAGTSTTGTGTVTQPAQQPTTPTTGTNPQ